jgi:hypothetical protein
MMKRPRSFISTLLIFLGLATVTLGLTVKTHDAFAGPTTRLMDPRAGDPTEPDDAPLPGSAMAPDPGGDALMAPNYISRAPRTYVAPSLQTALSNLWSNLRLWFERR